MFKRRRLGLYFLLVLYFILILFAYVCMCAHMYVHTHVCLKPLCLSILRARGLQIGGQKRVRWPKLKPITLFSTYPFKSMWSQIWIFSIFHQALNLNNVYIYFSLKIWPLAVQYIPSGEI